MKLARRVEQLPPYLFARISAVIAEKRAQGIDVISLGIGDPDLPTPTHVLEALKRAADVPANHRYPPEAVAARGREAGILRIAYTLVEAERPAIGRAFSIRVRATGLGRDQRVVVGAGRDRERVRRRKGLCRVSRSAGRTRPSRSAAPAH